MKTILRRAIERLEHALDSGLLISEDYEQAILFDEILVSRRTQPEKFPVD